MDGNNDRRRQLSQPLLYDDVDSHIVNERNQDMHALSNDLLQLRFVFLPLFFIYFH